MSEAVETSALSKEGLEAATLSALPAIKRMWAIAEALKAARRDAIEQCAKVAEDEAKTFDLWSKDADGRYDAHMFTAKDIAKSIRALTKPANEGEG